MKENRIFFSRYQTPSDAYLRGLCRSLKHQEIIHKYFICRYHFTNIVIHQDGYPLQLRDVNDLLHAFEGEALAAVRALVADKCEDDTVSHISHDDSGHME